MMNAKKAMASELTMRFGPAGFTGTVAFWITVNEGVYSCSFDSAYCRCWRVVAYEL